MHVSEDTRSDEEICPKNQNQSNQVNAWLRSKKEVISFLGMVGLKFYIALTEIKKKGKPKNVEWSTTTEHAMQVLKNNLSESTMLKNLDFTWTFQLQTDASDVGIRVVLGRGGEKIEEVIWTRKECLAIVLHRYNGVCYVPWLIQWSLYNNTLLKFSIGKVAIILMRMLYQNNHSTVN